MDPRAMKNLMAKMGIKSSEVGASRVVIESGDKTIVITNPQVTKIEAQGVTSFQVIGEISEHETRHAIEITEDDIATVSAQTGVSDKEKVTEALQSEKGDIAAAIIRLKKKAAEEGQIT
jgi:nascent polypeptide-associated complex subunit alpha